MLIAFLATGCKHAVSSGMDGGAPMDLGPPKFGELRSVAISNIPAKPIVPDMAPPGGIQPIHSRNIGFGDFNGDGYTDIVVQPNLDTTPPALPPWFWLNRGDGTFYDGSAQVLADNLLVEQGAITVADFNGDKRPDVFINDSGFELYGDTSKFCRSRSRSIRAASSTAI